MFKRSSGRSLLKWIDEHKGCSGFQQDKKKLRIPRLEKIGFEGDQATLSQRPQTWYACLIWDKKIAWYMLTIVLRRM